MLINGLIEKKEALDFSQNFSIARNYLGDRLFPDRKTEFFEAEYSRLADRGTLPTLAMVHAFDTEAAIGERPAFEKVTVEKLLVKEKINQTEELNRVLGQGVTMDAVKRYVFDDMGRLADSVKNRTEFMKMQVISSGKIDIDGNGIKMTIPCGVPDENRVTADWSDPDADILGDIDSWVDIAAEHGYTVTDAVTSKRIFRMMKKNKAIQTQLFGVAAVGTMPTDAQVNGLLYDHFGFMVTFNDERYKKVSVVDGEKVEKTERYFPEDTFSLFANGANGVLGAGLWGVTPEEAEAGGAFDTKRQQQYITLAQWTTPDPVAVWTKASGLFIPVLPNPSGLIVATIKADSVKVTNVTVRGDDTVAVGATIALTKAVTPSNASNKEVSWESDDPATATVDANGTVTGVKAGTATITATAKDGSGKYGTKDVTVTE